MGIRRSPKETVRREGINLATRRGRWRCAPVKGVAQSNVLGWYRPTVIATNGVRYAKTYDREVQDLFTAIRHHVELDRAGRLLSINSRRHLRSAREMAALFRDVPGAVEELNPRPKTASAWNYGIPLADGFVLRAQTKSGLDPGQFWVWIQRPQSSK